MRLCFRRYVIIPLTFTNLTSLQFSLNWCWLYVTLVRHSDLLRIAIASTDYNYVSDTIFSTYFNPSILLLSSYQKLFCFNKLLIICYEPTKCFSFQLIIAIDINDNSRQYCVKSSEFKIWYYSFEVILNKNHWIKSC